MSAVDSESRRALTDQELIDTLFTLISAGHGATAIVLPRVVTLPDHGREPELPARR